MKAYTYHIYNRIADQDIVIRVDSFEFREFIYELSQQKTIYKEYDRKHNELYFYADLNYKSGKFRSVVGYIREIDAVNYVRLEQSPSKIDENFAAEFKHYRDEFDIRLNLTDPDPDLKMKDSPGNLRR